MSSRTHLARFLEARLYYTNAVGGILAERPNCLAKVLLDRWARIREIVWAAETADSLLEGNSDAADLVLIGKKDEAYTHLTKTIVTLASMNNEGDAQ